MNNEINAAATDTPSLKGAGKELGESGTMIQGGIISAEEYNSSLTHAQAIKKYEIMRRSDATVRAMLQVCKLPIQSTEWYVDAASQDAADIEIKEFIEDQLLSKNISFASLLSQALTMFDFGYSVFEKVYEVTTYNNKLYVGIKKIASRKQSTIYKWEIANGDEGITQSILGKTIEIPRDKLIIFTHEKEGDNYEGISMLRYAYKHWDIKDKLDLINAIALEKLSIGVPVLKAPQGADPTERASARVALAEMRANEASYIDLPIGWEIEMLDMKAGTTKDVLPTIAYHDLQIVKSVLAQFLELGTNGSGGSRALSSDQTLLFQKSLEVAANNIATTLQNELIKQLCDMNFSTMPNGYPQLRFGKIGDDNIAELSDAVQKLASASMLTPGAELETHIRKVLKLPALPEEYINDYASRPTAPKPKQDPTLQPETKPEVLPTKASALNTLQKANNKLIDILVRE